MRGGSVARIDVATHGHGAICVVICRIVIEIPVYIKAMIECRVGLSVSRDAVIVTVFIEQNVSVSETYCSDRAG